MLIDMMTGKQITQVPYAKKYQVFIPRMSAIENAAFRYSLNTMIKGTELYQAAEKAAISEGPTTCSR